MSQASVLQILKENEGIWMNCPQISLHLHQNSSIVYKSLSRLRKCNFLEYIKKADKHTTKAIYWYRHKNIED